MKSDFVMSTRTSSGDQKKKRESSVANGENSALRRVKQAGSTLFLVAAIANFPDSVCNIYRLGCLVNLGLSIVYHGTQESAQPKRPHLARLPSSQYEFSCSKLHDHRWDHWLLRRMDKAAVCFICLYTGTNGSSYHPVIVAVVSIAAGFVGMMINEVVVGWALYLTLQKLDEVSETLRLTFAAAAIGGPIVYFYMDAIGAWCTPYRYMWHMCCGCLVAVGGLLNS